MWNQISNIQPKNFVKNTKTPNLSQKTWKPRFKCMKCIKKGKMKKLRALTKWKMFGLGRKLEGRKVFGENVRFG